MPLSDLVFSDLLILPDGTGRLKGCPDSGQQLVELPGEYADEISDLPNKLTGAFLTSRRDPETGARVGKTTIRFLHQDVHYRAADFEDVNGGRTWFLRRLPEKVPGLSTLGLPPYLCEWLLMRQQRHGLVLVAGAQASGKTTTASALVAGRLEHFGGHGVTFECPAELPLAGAWGEHGYCFQTEIDSEAELAVHIERAHLYASPNVIFIGEIHTRHAATESLRVAMGSRQQLVVATIHGFDVQAALERLLNWARETDGANAAGHLANSLLAVIFQDLECEERLQKVPQFLLLPFPYPGQSNESLMRVQGTRAKLRSCQLHSLGDDMRQIKNIIGRDGLEAI
ncbi:ATPase, T2SS/T4P/T4SS family [Fundidesulfovibrio putealis]|uniref:ATPase, T2SS/T4P/T4SS family n=1 Tax=Fundidesulfovibrio putealis TaxID=270496 RepID=UPI0004842006|nr:ATPase, T2SS/T4P/T4SS family [Fundidesulfovibrio putealis]KAF0234898.1 MAG: Type II secretion system protein [Desulfovibrionaceae bacterium]